MVVIDFPSFGTHWTASFCGFILHLPFPQQQKPSRNRHTQACSSGQQSLEWPCGSLGATRNDSINAPTADLRTAWHRS